MGFYDFGQWLELDFDSFMLLYVNADLHLNNDFDLDISLWTYMKTKIWTCLLSINIHLFFSLRLFSIIQPVLKVCTYKYKLCTWTIKK